MPNGIHRSRGRLAATTAALISAVGCASTPPASTTSTASRVSPAPTAEVHSYSRADVQNTGNVGNVAGALALLDPRVSAH